VAELVEATFHELARAKMAELAEATVFDLQGSSRQNANQHIWIIAHIMF